MRLLLLTSLILGICNSPIHKEKSLIIYLERTACFGTCPIYTIEIFNDGSGIYTGKRFVEKIGKIQFNVKKKDLENILKQAKKIGFNKFNDTYTEPVTDLPTTFIQIKDKKIKDHSGSPKELRELENSIDLIFKKSVLN